MSSDKTNNMAGEQKFATIAAVSADVILEAMIDGVVVVDRNGNIVRGNIAYAKMHGFNDPAEMVGMNITKIIAEREIPRVMDEFKKHLETGIRINLEFFIKDKNGRETPIQINSRVLKDEKGKIVGVIAAIRDITERKQAETALVESEEKYRHLFENSQVGMYRSKIDGSAILDVNEKWLEIFGYSKEEIMGKPSLIIWANPEKREPFIQQLKEKGALVNYEIDLLTKGGGIRSCLVSASIFSDKGIIEGTIVDITERKKMEKELKNKIHDMEIFQKSSVDRELKMAELKKEIATLKAQIAALKPQNKE